MGPGGGSCQGPIDSKPVSHRSPTRAAALVNDVPNLWCCSCSRRERLTINGKPLARGGRKTTGLHESAELAESFTRNVCSGGAAPASRCGGARGYATGVTGRSDSFRYFGLGAVPLSALVIWWAMPTEGATAQRAAPLTTITSSPAVTGVVPSGLPPLRTPPSGHPTSTTTIPTGSPTTTSTTPTTTTTTTTTTRPPATTVTIPSSQTGGKPGRGGPASSAPNPAGTSTPPTSGGRPLPGPAVSGTPAVPTTPSTVSPTSSPGVPDPSLAGCQPDPAPAIAALPPGGEFVGTGCYLTSGILITKPVTIDGGVYTRIR